MIMAAVGAPLQATMAYLPPQGSNDSWINTGYCDDLPLHHPNRFDPFNLSDSVGSSSMPSIPDLPQKLVFPLEVDGETGQNSGSSGRKCESGVKRMMKMDDDGSRIEILDDGFKWRKYGKKSLKNSPNPRNYYRCSTEGCSVKKRVERDPQDPSYVITVYEGVHNHMSPGVFYFTPHLGFY